MSQTKTVLQLVSDIQYHDFNNHWRAIELLAKEVDALKARQLLDDAWASDLERQAKEMGI